MTKFVERTKAPKKGEKYYSTLNPFANGKYDMFKNKGNCCHYAYARMSEVMGKKSGLPTCNAENWIKKVSKTFKTGKTPEVGAVIVYKHTKKSGGHVAFVEKIKSNGDLVLSMSGWKTYIFKRKTVTKKAKYVYSDYKLLGFIYAPVNFDDNKSNTTNNSTKTKYKTLCVMNIRKSATSTSAKVGSLKKGEVFESTSIRKNGNQTWAKMSKGYVCIVGSKTYCKKI